MERLVQEERLPRTEIRARVWGMNGRKKVAAVQDTLSKRWRRGKAGLGIGTVLAFTASGRRKFHMALPSPLPHYPQRGV